MTIRVMPEWVERYQTTTPPLPGWFHEEDLHLFAVINDIQLAAQAQCGLLEVGGYLAKSSVALGFMRREHEPFTVVDPWSSQVDLEENALEQNLHYKGASLDEFKANYRRFHSELPDIRQGISNDELKHLPAQGCRFIHIDGSHEWRVVSTDVDQVVRILSPGGVVAFDDLFSRHCAGVGAAVWPACARGDLVPVATTNKLYATRGPSTSVSAASLAQAIQHYPNLRIQERHPIFGWEVLQVIGSSQPPLLRRWRRYVPPVLVDVAKAHNLDTRILRTLARPRRRNATAYES